MRWQISLEFLLRANSGELFWVISLELLNLLVSTSGHLSWFM